MRKISLTILFLSTIHQVFSASTSLPRKAPTLIAKEVMVPLMGTNQFISLEDFLLLTPKSYRQIAGKKMSLTQKLDLGISKHFVRKMIRKDGSVDIEKMKKRGFFSGWHWRWGGFALGLFLNVLGPIVALFFNDDYKWDRFWTAMHRAIYVWLIAVIIIAVSGGGLN
jgi:hypothetical protein